MKRIRTVIALFLVFTVWLCLPAVSAEAAADLSEATELSSLNSASFSNSETGTQTYLFKISLKDSGKIRFYNSSSVTGSSSRLSLLYSDGRKAVTGKFSDVVGKIMYIGKKGTYYVQVSLTKSQSVRGFGYTFIADSGNRVTKKITLTEGRTYNFAVMVKNISGTRRWTTSDSSVAKVNTKGGVKLVGEGTAKIRVYSSRGDYAVITVTSKPAGTE